MSTVRATLMLTGAPTPSTARSQVPLLETREIVEGRDDSPV
jgi:hypothetical protein